MKKKLLWSALFVLFTAVIIIVNVSKAGKSLSVSYISPKEGTIADKVFASGKLEAVNVHPLYMDNNFVIQEVKVIYGDKVKKGQVLLTYNLEDIERQLQQENNNLHILMAEQKNLFKQQFDSMKKQVEAQDETLQNDKETIDTTSNQLRINNQKLVIEALERKLSISGLTADYDGVVTELHAEAKQMLPQGTKVMVITETNKLQVRANMSELDIGKIKLGMGAMISGDAFQQTFQGKVRSIAPIAAISSPTVKEPVVEVLIDVDGDFKSGEIKPGYNVNVECSILNKQQLLLPLRAVKHEGDSAYAFKQVDGKAVQVNLKTGKEDDEHVEVLEGINVNDILIAVVTADLQEGKKVKAP